MTAKIYLTYHTLGSPELIQLRLIQLSILPPWSLKVPCRTTLKNKNEVFSGYQRGKSIWYLREEQIWPGLEEAGASHIRWEPGQEKQTNKKPEGCSANEQVFPDCSRSRRPGSRTRDPSSYLPCWPQDTLITWKTCFSKRGGTSWSPEGIAGLGCPWAMSEGAWGVRACLPLTSSPCLWEFQGLLGHFSRDLNSENRKNPNICYREPRK